MTDATATDASATAAFAACLVADDDRLLLLRHAFSHRVDPGAWTTALHGHPSPGEGPEEAARRRALRVLGLRLDDVRTVVPAAPVPGTVDAVPTSVLVARVRRRRVVVPDPTVFDEAEWVGWPELLRSVHDGTLRLAAWCVGQLEQWESLGLPGTAWRPDPVTGRAGS